MATGLDLEQSTLALSWSGGKDSSLALWVLREEHGVSPCVMIPAECTNEVYEQRMADAFASDLLQGISCVAAGDLFLEDVREYREQRLGAAGMTAVFPLWKRHTTKLAHQFIAAGFEATLVCVDPGKLDPSFAGRAFDENLLADFPSGVDPCGENGEFHTFVHDGPIFTEPVACRPGGVVTRGGFVFCELLDVGA